MTQPFNKALRKQRESVLNDNSPSFRQQSYSHIYWDQISAVLGQPFDMTKIPLSKLYQMRRDPMISFALHYIKVPLITAQWYIKCEDAQVAAFVDYALRRIYGDLVLQYMNSLDFGFAAMVKRFDQQPVPGTYINPDDPDQVEQKIWEYDNIDPIIWKNFVGLPPEMVLPDWQKSSGDFNGIIYDVETDRILGFPTAPYEENDNAHKVPLDHSLWVTNDRPSVFGSIWGFPRIGSAFRYWWSYWYWWALLDRHVEKDADPPAIVRYPGDPNDEVLDAQGNPIDYREIALGIGEQARSGSTIALPSDVVESHVDGRLLHNVPLWDLKFVENNQNFKEFTTLFDRLEILKLRSIMVPEQAFMEGQGGSSSRNVADTMGNAFDKSQSVLMQEFDDHINRYVIPQLIDLNFRDRKVVAQKVSVGFSSDDLEMSKLLVTLVGQGAPNELGVDVRKILERMGVPVLTHEQILHKQQEAIAAAAAAQPPLTPGGPGQAGVVPAEKPPMPNGPGVPNPTRTGFTEQHTYIQPRQYINLDRQLHSVFAEKVKDIPQFTDTGIMSYAFQIRSMWEEAFQAEYENFAEFVRHAALDLNEEFDESLYLDAKLVPNKPGVTNWVEKLGGLPKKIADMAGDLITEKGFTTSHAIATAVSRAKLLAVHHPEWADAIKQWEDMRARTHAHASDDIAFAVFMLNLAADDSNDKKANRIVAAWKSRIASVSDQTVDIVKSVMRRAAELEIKRTHLAVDFDPGSNAVADWVEQHGAFLATTIDHTTREELREFLSEQFREGHGADEIAAQIRDHFEEFPAWKADRVARTETMLAYNFATLFAAQQAGIKRVQALDARKGKTDQECHDRNGRIFTINDAFQETTKEHPNGTLAWRLLKPKNLSVEYVEDSDKLAWYSGETETVYFAQGIAPEQEERYLLMMTEYWNAETNNDVDN